MRRNAALLIVLASVLTACGGGTKADAPASTAKAARQVAISTTDALRFEPATLTAKAGETVEFVVTNSGKLAHEFAIGSQKYMDDAAMAHGGGHGADSAEGAVVSVPAGKSAKLTYTMPQAAPTYACHTDRHDKAGMVGTVTY